MFTGLSVYKSYFLRELYHKISLTYFLELCDECGFTFVIEKDTNVEAPEHTRNAGRILIPITHVPIHFKTVNHAYCLKEGTHTCSPHTSAIPTSLPL